MGLPVEKLRRATYADLEAVPANKVAELIRGTRYVMPRPASRRVDGASLPKQPRFGLAVPMEGARVGASFEEQPSTRATSVVTPDRAIERPLPINTDVVVDRPVSAPGELMFRCGMGGYKGKVVAR